VSDSSSGVGASLMSLMSIVTVVVSPSCGAPLSSACTVSTNFCVTS
jgi:hypothetical protein